MQAYGAQWGVSPLIQDTAGDGGDDAYAGRVSETCILELYLGTAETGLKLRQINVSNLLSREDLKYESLIIELLYC